MPKSHLSEEDALRVKREARARAVEKFPGDKRRQDAYTYGAARHAGWRPKREMKSDSEYTGRIMPRRCDWCGKPMGAQFNRVPGGQAGHTTTICKDCRADMTRQHRERHSDD